MNNIYCYIASCVHNRQRKCSKTLVSISWKTSNEFSCGERKCYAACDDYEELEKDGTD